MENTNPSKKNEDALKDLLKKISGIKDDEDGRLFNEARKYDEFLYSLAAYHATNGLTRNANPQDIMNCFVEFKMMVVRNEATIAELEKLVVGRFSLLGHLPESERKIIGFNNETAENISIL